MVKLFLFLLVFYAIVATSLILLSIAGFIFSTVSPKNLPRYIVVAVLFPLFLLHPKGRFVITQIIRSFN